MNWSDKLILDLVKVEMVAAWSKHWLNKTVFIVGNIPGFSEWYLFTNPAKIDDIFLIALMYWHSMLWTPAETLILGDRWFNILVPK